jgi:hypothetical protein
LTPAAPELIALNSFAKLRVGIDASGSTTGTARRATTYGFPHNAQPRRPTDFGRRIHTPCFAQSCVAVGSLAKRLF